MNIFFENVSLKNAWLSSFFDDWILRVANFGINYLIHFFINFKNSCDHLAANFQEAVTKSQKNKKWEVRKYVNFSQPWMLAFFRIKFFNFYSFLSLISTKLKSCQYLRVKRAQKTTRKLLKMSHIKACKVDMPKILVCDVGVLTPADFFCREKAHIQQYSLYFASVNNTLPHIFLIYRIVLNDPWSETKH